MSNKKQVPSPDMRVARTVRDACIRAAEEGFQDASMRGLCSEGAIEAAIGAIQSLDIKKIAAEASQQNR